MSKDFLDELFFEIFGKETFDKMLDAYTKLYSELEKESDNKEDKEEKDKKEDHSYFHTVTDTYDNGEHISHKEKEVKDGKVLKDVNETFKIEDKKECCSNIKNSCEEVCNNDITWYEDKLKEANDLLNEAKETIQQQTEVIGDYQKRCENYENKLSKLRTLLKG